MKTCPKCNAETIFRNCPLCLRVAHLAGQSRVTARRDVKRRADQIDRAQTSKAIRVLIRLATASRKAKETQ